MTQVFRRKRSLNAAASQRRLEDIEREITEQMIANRAPSQPSAVVQLDEPKTSTDVEPLAVRVRPAKSVDRVFEVLTHVPKSVAMVTSELEAVELGYDVVNDCLRRLVKAGRARKSTGRGGRVRYARA